MRLTFIGSGDAFGSGGRFNTCLLVEAGRTTMAVDFGATSLVALKQRGISPNSIDTVVLTHLHGDHFGGLPFLLLDAQFASSRKTPLTIAGPPGTRERLEAALEVFYPGAIGNDWRFPLKVIDMPLRTPWAFGEARVESHEVVHASGAPSTGVRVTAGGRVLAYSGDTTWTDALVDIARDADLFVVECYRPAGRTSNHLDLRTLIANRDRLTARAIMLTHMSEAMLAAQHEAATAGFLVAEDGLTREI
ncbi:hypothetical protein BOQ54_06895 [Chelatococcus daeguensis]|uniref:Metallo-beta-lactamase domain-containing protein n=1 Tax=Chelatococcus daeguensis TaxID=444444 RepID=A0AAC9JRE7_9HYPH|nr:MBL fold metallo-hydrolase [Chelatococcus daeguensis]APF37091.1 hypothetical protein BOQ54_06895 [Chelatococcus daeguensis]